MGALAEKFWELPLELPQRRPNLRVIRGGLYWSPPAPGWRGPRKPKQHRRRRTQNAIALVGTSPAVQTGAASAAVAGVWGTGQSRTAGNLLTCEVAGDSVATAPATPSGWSVANTNTGTSCSSAIFYKIATGGDAAPTIAAVTNQIWNVLLNEYSGTDPVTPFDQATAAAGTTSPLVCAAASTDRLAKANLVLYAYAIEYSAAATKTFTPTLNNGQSSNISSNAGTSTGAHYWLDWGLTSLWGATANDQVSLAVTTTKLTGMSASMAVFKVTDPGPGTCINDLSISNNSTGSSSYSVNLPRLFVGDLIVVSGTSNGTHATNGMSCIDSGGDTFTTVAEIQNTNASSRWGQVLIAVAQAASSNMSFTPYAAATTSSFSVNIFRGYTANVDQTATTNNSPLGTTASGTAFSSAPSAGALVLACVSAASTSLTLGTGTGTFTAGSQTTTTADTGVAFVLAADGSTNYVASWTLGASNSWGVIQVALAPVASPFPPRGLQLQQAVMRAANW